LLFFSEVEPVNVGNPQEMTILEFAHLVNEITGNSSGIVHEPLPEDDPKVRQPDISRARQVLGWEPEVSLEDGLSETITWFQERLGGRPPRGSGG
jgi:dTDP-glucose 4,6-dehydratase